MRTHSPILLLIFSILFAGFTVNQYATAESPPLSGYEALKARYMKLRNTDKEIERKAQWLDIINDLENFSRSHRSSSNAAVSLSQAGAMSLEMFRVLKDKQYLNKSKALFESILADFKESGEADDALIKIAEIESDYLQDKPAAIESLKRLLKEYPSGDMYEAAEMRIKQLEGSGSDDNSEEDDTDAAIVPEGKYKVILDPGHGGEDFGAVGVGGIYEKDVVLDISHKLKKILESKYKIKTVMTRESDEFVPLYERTAFANEQNGNVFISIHANASEKKNLQGLEIYYLDNTSDKASKKLADRENASMQFEGPEADLRYMLSDLIQDSKLQESLRLADILGASIINGLAAKGFNIKNHGTKKAPFYVLVGAYMPCVLVETGFIDNAQEGQKLADKAFRTAIAESFAEGIFKFLPQQ